MRRFAAIGLGILLGLLSLACLSWGVAQAFLRPPDYGEACVLFSASRIREGLTLYVDPLVGAHEYGEPPARYFVPYTPLFAAALAALPAANAMVVARLGGLVLWFALLATCVITAHRDARRTCALGALFVSSIFLFARWSACARPDVVALALCGLALLRTLDRARADALAGALFALAAALKPNVIGIGLGALGASTVLSSRRSWAGVASAATVGALILAALEIASRGAAVRHLIASVGLAFDPQLLMGNVASRAPFIAGLIAAALLASRQALHEPRARIAQSCLVVSCFVVCVGLGKLGSASNYLMEPSLAAVAVLSRFPLRTPQTRAGLLALAASVGVSVLWASDATLHSLFEQRSQLAGAAPALARIRTKCIDRPGAIVMSMDPGIELAVNGRLYTHPLELWNESRHGRFPEALWAEDVQNASVRCVVNVAEDGRAPRDPVGTFPPLVARAMASSFGPPTMEGGYAVYPATGRGRAVPVEARR